MWSRVSASCTKSPFARAGGAVFGLGMVVSAAMGQMESPAPGVALLGPTVEESSEVANLLRIAEDAVARADWKLAIDSLQRVIDEPLGLRPDAMEPSLFTSPRRSAYEVLVSLPAEGMGAYRILYDGRAKGMLEEARREHDLTALRHLCDRYLMTRHGPEAASLLASWLLDLGREAEALSVLDDLLAVTGEKPEVENQKSKNGEQATDHMGLSVEILGEIELKRAVALELLGDWRAAAECLEAARSAAGGTPGPLVAVDGVQAFITESRGAALAAADGRLSAWSGPGGGGANLGVMQGVVPSFAESSPWVRSIPSIIPGVWPDLDVLRSNMLPVTQPAVADGRMFVKAGRECVAIDVESFAVLWTAEPTATGIVERSGVGVSPSTVSEQDLLSDYVAQTLTTSHGLVFSVERGDPGVSFGVDGVVVLRRRGVGNRLSAEDHANRLVAIDASTGAIRWRRGRGVGPEDRLRRARFLAPPVGVGEDVWAPFESSGDLYVAILDPADGELKRLVFLCALGGRAVNDHAALFMAVADGYVFVPTNQGMLFALSAEDGRIRWASRYRSSVPPRRGRGVKQAVSVPVEWLSCPPVVTGGTVLLAPGDDDRLIAFDEVSGEVAWNLPREGHRYVMGADREHAWVGGAAVSCVSLSERSYVWRVPVVEPTGRAVVSGGTIYAPTRSNLTVMDAETGVEGEALDLPSDQTPLGNLLCLSDVMISLDPSEVRSFPDRNSYDTTLATHRANPTDSRAAIRLAFMELLNNRPRAALAALDGAVAPVDTDGALHSRHVAHLRVEALLQLGSAGGAAAEESVGYLREAVSAATSARDQVESQLSLGRKLRELGRFKEAYQTFFALGIGPLAEGSVGTREVRRVTRLVVADQLRRIAPELGAAERQELSEETGAAVKEAAGRCTLSGSSVEAVERLRALADAAVIGGWDQAALNELGRFAVSDGKYERAEQYFRESARRGPNRARTAEALLELMDTYLDPSQSLHYGAREIADRLAREYSDVRLTSGTVPELLADRRRRISASVLSMHTEGISPSRFVVGADSTMRAIQGDDVVGMVRFRGDRPESLADRMLVFAAPKTARSYHIGDGLLEWEAELRLLDDFAFAEAMTERNAVGGGALDSRTALADGQTVVIGSSRGLHAVGAITGRGLWAIPFRAGQSYGEPAHRAAAATDVADGRIACMLASRTLAVYRAMDGKHPMSPIWRRNMGSESVRVVRIRDGVVLTAGPRLETVHVFAMDTGVALCDLAFRQPSAGTTSEVEIPLAYAKGVLAGPDGRAIVGYDVRTGTRLWSRPLAEDPVGMFEPAEGTLVVTGASGYCWMLDTRSGQVLLERRFDELPGGPVDGVLDSGVLVLSGVEETADGYRWSLAGVDLSAGDGVETLWTRDFIGTVVGPHLNELAGVIPVVTMEPTARDAEAHREGRMRNSWYRQSVVLIDKRTGESVGETLYPEIPGERLTGEMAVWPGRLALQTTRGVVTYGTTTEQDAGGDSEGVD